MISAKSMEKIFGICLFAVVLIFFTGICEAASPQAPATIKIGAISGLTGPLSAQGQVSNWAFKVAINDINQGGGLFVKEFNKKIPLELITIDHQSLETKATSAMETLYEQNVVAVTGDTVIDSCPGVSEKYRIPTISLSANVGAFRVGSKYWFAGTALGDRIAKGIFDFIDSVPGHPSKLGIPHGLGEWESTMGDFFKKEAAARNYTVVASDRFPRMNKDFSTILLKMKQSGAEGVVSCMIAPDGITLMKQMKELDYNVNLIFLMTAPAEFVWANALKKDGDYVCWWNSWHSSLPFPGVERLNKKFEAEFGRKSDPMTGAGYAAIEIIASAVGKAGSLDRTKIRDTLSTAEITTTISVPVKYNPDGSQVNPCMVMGQWQQGIQKITYPQKWATGTTICPIPPWNKR